MINVFLLIFKIFVLIVVPDVLCMVLVVSQLYRAVSLPVECCFSERAL